MLFNLELPIIISRIITLLIAFTVHEFSHAAIATLFGDSTPRAAGRLTLNPLKHLDIFGTIMLLVAGFGWAKPVPINPYAINRKNKAGVMLVSLAGPASNFLLASIAAIPLRFNWIPLIKGTSDIFPSLGRVRSGVCLHQPGSIPVQPDPSATSGWREDHRLLSAGALGRKVGEDPPLQFLYLTVHGLHPAKDRL